MKIKSEIYLKSILEEVPRILCMLDRNPLSRTYGCFDRNYWHYNITDFPSARFQEAALTLAILYKTNHKLNPYYKKKEVLEWAIQSINFWAEIQASNGSFSEWYPNENSFVATAFSTYAISEALLVLGNEFESKANIKESISKSANWLCRKKETTVQNQETGSVAALYNSYLITENKKFLNACKEKVKKISKSQNEEGWFSEYGGPDIGYLSLAIDYLGKYYSKSKDETALKILEKSTGFIKYFIHPDFTCGGEYSSRNTEYLIPHGFEILSNLNEDSASISDFIIECIRNSSGIIPRNLDERYLVYNGYTYLQAYLDFSSKKSTKRAHAGKFEKYFKNCGIFVKSTDDFYFISNLNKGGSFRIIFKKGSGEKSRNHFQDSGISIISGKNKLTSSWISSNNSSLNQVHFEKNTITITGKLIQVSTKTLTPSKNAALRIFQSTIGRSEQIGKFVKGKLRSNMILASSQSDYDFSRKIEFFNDSVKITDTLSNIPIDNLYLSKKESYIYVPSSRYFQEKDIQNNPLSFHSPKFRKISRIYSSKGMKMEY